MFGASDGNERFTTKGGGREQKGVWYNGVTAESKSLSKLRVSVVQYLNTAPLVWGFTKGPLQGKYELSLTVPSLCAEGWGSGAAAVRFFPEIDNHGLPGLGDQPVLRVL